MKIVMSITLSDDNELRFYDACRAASDRLLSLAHKAVQDGNAGQFIGTTNRVIEDTDHKTIGKILVTE